MAYASKRVDYSNHRIRTRWAVFVALILRRQPEMTKGYSVQGIANTIPKIVQERMANRLPEYYVSDSVSVSKEAMRRYMKDSGDSSLCDILGGPKRIGFLCLHSLLVLIGI